MTSQKFKNLNYLCIEHFHTVAMLVHQANPLEIEIFSYLNTFFCSKNLQSSAWHMSENALYVLQSCFEHGINFRYHSYNPSQKVSGFNNVLLLICPF